MAVTEKSGTEVAISAAANAIARLRFNVFRNLPTTILCSLLSHNNDIAFIGHYKFSINQIKETLIF